KFHSVEFYARPVQILNVKMSAAFLSRFSALADPNNSPIGCRSENIVRLGSRLVKESILSDDLSAFAIEAIVLDLLVEVSRESSQNTEPNSSGWIVKAKEYLHDSFSEPITLKNAAKAVGVHPVHLARTFRRQFGCSIGEYVRFLRVEFAKSQISSTKKPLAEIALCSGFSDQSHLSKTFKNLAGITPNEYRKNYRSS
ncbi:MAG: helix-turn-helix transcriptional regulator, partial [Acidobacteria bacterium]|nr:helix-turn-helix transcriptional regulator [Acidobacteriota bacterium]